MFSVLSFARAIRENKRTNIKKKVYFIRLIINCSITGRFTLLRNLNKDSTNVYSNNSHSTNPGELKYLTTLQFFSSSFRHSNYWLSLPLRMEELPSLARGLINVCNYLSNRPRPIVSYGIVPILERLAVDICYWGWNRN